MLGIFAAVSEDPDRALRTAQQIAEDVREQIRRARKAEAAARAEAEKWEQALAVVESRMGEHIAAVEEEKALKSVPTRPMMAEMDLGRNEESRALKIAKTRSAGKKRDPAYQAILDAGMTPEEAAAVCGTSRDVLKQCWARGKQFREIRSEWKKRLAAKGVPATVWRTKN